MCHALKEARRNFAETRSSSVAALSTVRKDTRLIPSSLGIRRAEDGTRRQAPSRKGEARLEQRRLKTLWQISRSQISPRACQPVRALPETVGNRPATPSDDACSSGQTICLLSTPVFIQRSPRSSSSKNVLVKIQFKSPSDTLASGPTHWSTSSLVLNYRTQPQFSKVSTRRVPKHPASWIATLWPSTIAVESSSPAEASGPPQRLIFFTVLIGCMDVGCARFTSTPWPQVSRNLLPPSSVPSPRNLRHLFRRP